jgi:beta-galactosidase
VQRGFDDSDWQQVDLPHDWAIRGPFFDGPDAQVGGGMGCLPSPGVAWYRKTLHIPASDRGRSLFLEVEGAMSYALVWLNGTLVGGWPYGYSSWQVDLTPYVLAGADNQLAIRLDNPPHSSRWYPGGGLYRNVWLNKTQPLYVGQWGTFLTTTSSSTAAATIELEVKIDNDSSADATVEALTQVYALDEHGLRIGDAVARFEPLQTAVAAGHYARVRGAATIEKPRLWGPPPTQLPHRRVIVRGRAGQPGPLQLRAEAAGLRAGTLLLQGN